MREMRQNEQGLDKRDNHYETWLEGMRHSIDIRWDD